MINKEEMFKDSIKKYKYFFIIMSYGEVIETHGFNDFDKAQDYYNKVYYYDNIGCYPIIDGKEYRFDKAYKYFKLYKLVNNLYYKDKGVYYNG